MRYVVFEKKRNLSSLDVFLENAFYVRSLAVWILSIAFYVAFIITFFVTSERSTAWKITLPISICYSVYVYCITGYLLYRFAYSHRFGIPKYGWTVILDIFVCYILVTTQNQTLFATSVLADDGNFTAVAGKIDTRWVIFRSSYFLACSIFATLGSGSIMNPFVNTSYTFTTVWLSTIQTTLTHLIMSSYFLKQVYDYNQRIKELIKKKRSQKKMNKL